MYHIFLLGREGFNYYNFLLYNIINSLIENSTNSDIIYHMSILNKSKNYTLETSKNIDFFNIKLPRLGSITYLIYDLISLIRSFYCIKKNKLKNAKIFLLSTRVGIFLPFFTKKLPIYVYYDRYDIERNVWTFFAKYIWEKSKCICIKYSTALISTIPYLDQTHKIINLNCDISTFDSTFKSFLTKFNVNINNYYLLIDDFKITNTTNFIIKNFLEHDSTRKLIILSRKTSLLYKYTVSKFDFLKDNRIICINIERFIHLIPHLSIYCHAYIHSDINAANNNHYFKNDNINLVLESPLNSRISLPNTLYFNEKSFLDILKKADKIPSKNIKLKNTNESIIRLVKTLEEIFTK